jgi:hypothetical protein
MTWYIFQGEDLKRDQKIVFPFYRSLGENFSDSGLRFKDELIQCNTVTPPKYPKEGVTKTNCVLNADLRSVPRTQFRKMKAAGGRMYYDVHYNLVVMIQSAVMKFSLEIGGEEMGSVDAKYS